MVSLKQAVAMQVDELVRASQACAWVPHSFHNVFFFTHCMVFNRMNHAPSGLEVHTVEAAVVLQVDLREEIAARKAEAASAATAHAEKANELKQAQEKLAETTLSLHQADVRGAQLGTEAGSLKRELAKEQRELVTQQTQLATVQEKLEKAKHWNDIQVRSCHICDCGCHHLLNDQSKSCMLSGEKCPTRALRVLGSA